MQTTNVNKTIGIILEDLGYDTVIIDTMSDTNRKQFCESVAPYIQEWLMPFQPLEVQSIPYITRTLCRRFDVPFNEEIEPKFVRKPKKLRGEVKYGKKTS
ncbi:hypothetical protein AM501_06645 [Aneurinibacillus migulanus]|uniref:hypothetical protein n=1 Tax=Aneurinibacillus migulanus TaxID=47500 RepID=UPI0005BE8B15|nr:hypothetical protein [Aneurinibacillus migulanus]KIV55268.1 hypothetical protein TS64_12020 [Aneurinibacillus migulanus]KPD09030.1 hypothetical protein AM501_06645 [Aneurinibacillus migulanus]